VHCDGDKEEDRGEYGEGRHRLSDACQGMPATSRPCHYFHAVVILTKAVLLMSLGDLRGRRWPPQPIWISPRCRPVESQLGREKAEKGGVPGLHKLFRTRSRSVVPLPDLHLNIQYSIPRRTDDRLVKTLDLALIQRSP
jgi:hypothetical protein